MSKVKWSDLIAILLRNDDSLTSMSLQPGSAVPARFWTALSQNTTLLRLDASNTTLGPPPTDTTEGASTASRDSLLALATCLRNNDCLQALDLTSCQLSDSDLGPLVQALAVNSGLRALGLSANAFSQRVAMVLEPVFRSNVTLYHLELSQVIPEHGTEPIELWRWEGENPVTGRHEEVNLRKLTSSNERVQEIVSDKADTLALEERNFIAIPWPVFSLHQLTRLDLSNNSIRCVPAAIKRLSNLNSLILSNNDLTTLPPELILVTSLQEVNLRANRFTEVPLSLSWLHNLKSLDVQDNDITSLPYCLGALTGLTSLKVTRSPALALPRNLESGSAHLIQWLQQRVTDADRHATSRIVVLGPKGVGKTSLVRCLQRMEASKARKRSRFTSSSSQSSPNLVQLSGASSPRRSPRVTIPGSTSPRSPSPTSPTSSPSSASYVRRPVLDLASVRMQQAHNERSPPRQGETGVRFSDEVEAGHDSGYASPPLAPRRAPIGSSAAIAAALSGRKATTLPHPVQRARSSDASLGNSPKGVTRHMNPLYVNRTKGPAAASASDGASSPGTGKKRPSAARRKASMSPIDGGDAAWGVAGGVTIMDMAMTLKVQGAKKRSTRSTFPLSFWEFADQHMALHTRRLHFSPDSVYVVLFDARYSVDRSRVDHWIKCIVRWAEGAPIFVVATHADSDAVSRRKGVGHAAMLMDWLTRSLDTVPTQALNVHCVVSCTTGKGMSELRQQLGRVIQARASSHMVPARYSVLQERLSVLRHALQPPIITWNSFRDMVVRVGMEGDRAREVARYLHQLGALVHFDDDESGLDDMVVVDQFWLHQVFDSILGLRAPLGLFHVSKLISLWKPPSFPKSTHATLLRLLHKFNLIHAVDHSTFVVPQEVLDGQKLKRRNNVLLFAPCLLGRDRPDSLAAHWPQHPDVDTLQVSRHYWFDELPMDFATRLFARLLQSGWTLLDGWSHGLLLCGTEQDVLERKREPSSARELKERRESRQRQRVDAGNTSSSSPAATASPSSGVGAALMAAAAAASRDGDEGVEDDTAVDDDDDDSIGDEADEELLLLEVNPVQHTLRVHIRTPSKVSRLLSTLLSCLHTVIDDWLRCKVTVDIPCIHCVAQREYDPYLFSFRRLQSLVAEGEVVAHCRSINPVRIHVMAPDIAVESIATHTIPWDALESGEELGVGAYAEVFRGTWKGEDVAVKRMIIPQTSMIVADDEEDKLDVFREFRREAGMMASLYHQNIVELKGICLKPFSLVLEYMNQGNLFTFLQKQESEMSWKLRAKLAIDVAKGMQFLHSITPPIIHRDLKSPNVLLHRKQGGRLLAKVSDFGLSRDVGLAPNLVGSTVDNPAWTAPEVIVGQPYDASSDVYSFGVILWEIVTQAIPWASERFYTKVADRIVGGERGAIPASCLPEVAQLIGDCWSADVSVRPAFRQIVARLAAIVGRYNLEVELEMDVHSGKASLYTTYSKVKRPTRSLLLGAQGSPVTRSSADLAPRLGGAMTGAGLLPQDKQCGYIFSDRLAPSLDCSVQCMVVLGDCVWAGTSRGDVHRWNIWTQKHLPPINAFDDGPALCMALGGAEGDFVCVGSGANALCVYDRSGALVRRTALKSNSGVTSMLCSARSILVAMANGDLRSVSLRSGKVKSLASLSGVGPVLHMLSFLGHLWIACGQTIFCMNHKDTYQLLGHTGSVHCMIVVGEREVWSCSSDKTICVWTFVDDVPMCVDILEGHSSRVFALTTDGSDFVWSGSWDKTVIAWNMRTHEFVQMYQSGHTDAVSSLLHVEAMGSHEMLLSGSYDHSVGVWQRATTPGSGTQRKKKRGSRIKRKKRQDCKFDVPVALMEEDDEDGDAADVAARAEPVPKNTRRAKRAAKRSIRKGNRRGAKVSPSASSEDDAAIGPMGPSASGPEAANALARRGMSLKEMGRSAGHGDVIRVAGRPVLRVLCDDLETFFPCLKKLERIKVEPPLPPNAMSPRGGSPMNTLSPRSRAASAATPVLPLSAGSSPSNSLSGAAKRRRGSLPGSLSRGLKPKKASTSDVFRPATVNKLIDPSPSRKSPLNLSRGTSKDGSLG